MQIAVLIGIIISIVVGITLIPTITGSITELTTPTTVGQVVAGVTQTTSSAAAVDPNSGIGSLMGILPFIFVAMIILGAVSLMGGMDEGGISIPWFHRKRKEVATHVAIPDSAGLRARVLEASSKLSEYMNNLDSYLGITTKRADYPSLRLIDKLLYIPKPTEAGGDFDWFLTAKHPTEPAFKVVGLNKKDANLDVVYTLGKNTQTGEPYLTKENDMSGGLVRLDKVESTPTSPAWMTSQVTSAIVGIAMMPAINSVVDEILKEHNDRSDSW